MKSCWWFILLGVVLSVHITAQTRLKVVELNAENLFDTQHDSLKNDKEFMPDAVRHWTKTKYWNKLNNISKVIISCGRDSNEWVLPDLVGLCEVENDTVLRDLTKRSLLRKARYEYITTSSPDERGIDVALLYSPFSFRLIKADTIRVVPLKEMRPTRDILHVEGEVGSGDTLHVFVVHAPSRAGGERDSRPNRLQVVRALLDFIDRLKATHHDVKLLVMGDFNDYSTSASIQELCRNGLVDVSAKAQGSYGAKGTYRYQGEWGSLDHILLSENLVPKVRGCRIHDMPFLLEDDTKYGGVKPRRNYNGMKYNNGFSDHLPLVLDLTL